jgi:hypothetical protein
MTNSSYVYESGTPFVVGSHGQHRYVYVSGQPVKDDGESTYVYESGTGNRGTTVLEDFERDNPLADYTSLDGEPVSYWSIVSSKFEGDKMLEASGRFGETSHIAHTGINVTRPGRFKLQVDPNGSAADPHFSFGVDTGSGEYYDIELNNTSTAQLRENGTQLDSGSLSQSGANEWVVEWKADDTLVWKIGSNSVTLSMNDNRTSGSIGWDNSSGYSEQYDNVRYEGI